MPQRRRRRKNRTTYNLTLAIVGILSVLTIVLCLSGVVTTLQDRNDPGYDQGGSLNHPSGADDTDPTNVQTTPTPPPTQGGYSTEQIDAFIADADFVAAGYDYEKAISMLTGIEGYEDYPALQEKVDEYTRLDSQLVVYDKPHTVTHIFFHSLIVDTDRAFDGDFDSGGYHSYMTTISEFIAMMEQMYERGFVLISPYDLAYETTDAEGNTVFTYGEIRLPEGKTPFLMSQDDVNYYSYMISSASGVNEIPQWADHANDGFASRIVIGENGYPTCEYQDADGNILYGDYDLVPVLETFIREHPDFSYHGARAILGVTGYEGVLGYRTKPSYEAAMGSDAYAAEVQAAKEVAQCLRDHGWILASHSYGHPAYGNISAEKVEIDSDKWEDTCEYIIGPTDVILYPHGSDIAGVGKYTFDNEKFAALYEDGYRYFFNVDSSVYWNQLGSNYFRGGRRNLDGYRMYHHPHKLSDLFDVATVWDPARPDSAPKV